MTRRAVPSAASEARTVKEEDLNQVLFTTAAADHTLIDTGCQKACAGERWYEDYKAALAPEELGLIEEHK